MGPRKPETVDEFLQRLGRELAAGKTEIRLGQYHFTHAVCAEEGVLRVRTLHCSREDADAHLREHGIFMPEHAEALSKPADLVMEAPTLEALADLLRSRWPL